MKGKVLTILKPLLASKGFSKDELEGLAEIASKNLTEASTEEEINNAISGVVPYAELMQKVGNRMVSSVENKYRGWVDPKSIDQKPEPEPEPKGLTPEDIHKLIAEGIEAGLKPYKEREEKQRLQSLLYSHEKVKCVPEMFRNKYNIEKEEDLESVAAQMESDFTALKQSLITSGEFVAPPQSGNGAGEVDDLITKLQNMGARGN